MTICTKAAIIDAEEIDKLLPQTQCGECGFAGCMPYADALAQGNAPINLCPPGGEETLLKLGELLDINPEPYLSNYQKRPAQLAKIIENECIGCTKCIQACPVDAIVGSAKMMHSIISHECTGCELCVEPCPVDCIEINAVPANNYDKNIARKRFYAKKARKLKLENSKIKNYQNKLREKKNNEDKKQFILEALKRSMENKVKINKN